jgi:hypothetical protein
MALVNALSRRAVGEALQENKKLVSTDLLKSLTGLGKGSILHGERRIKKNS